MNTMGKLRKIITYTQIPPQPCVEAVSTITPMFDYGTPDLIVNALYEYVIKQNVGYYPVGHAFRTEVRNLGYTWIEKIEKPSQKRPNAFYELAGIGLTQLSSTSIRERLGDDVVDVIVELLEESIQQWMKGKQTC